MTTTDATTTPSATAIAAERFAGMQQAWNQADGAAFGREFTEDADFTDIRGDHHKGNDAVVHGHQALFDSIYAGSTVRFEVESAREVVPGCVVAFVASTMVAPIGPLQGTNHATMTAVITEQGGRWAIAAFQNTLKPRTVG
jgi:uncharacterized protein (TIGR02246 family)